MDIILAIISLPLIAVFTLILLGVFLEHAKALLISIPVMVGIVAFAALMS
ncbi:MAG: hypothetical protein WC073_11445 [Sterolibacterium sp.]